MAAEKLDQQAKFTITNPTARWDYYTNPLNVLTRMIPGRRPRDDERRAELGGRVEEAIVKDPKLIAEREEHFKASGPARLIAHNPKLRTEYFEKPSKVLARAIPRRGLVARISLAVPERTRALRAELGERVEAIVSSDPRLISEREAAVEKNVFLSEALRNPQWTFNAILGLSIVAFLIGASLVVGAFLAGFLGDDTTEKAVLGGLSGGGGAVTTLGTVFAMSRAAIRKANGDNAQIRLILTGFATEITHLRAIEIDDFEDAQRRNDEIREATIEAVKMIEAYVEPREPEEPKEKKPKDQKPEEKPKEEGEQPETPGEA